MKSYVLAFFSIFTWLTLPLRSQGQQQVSIWTILELLEYRMLHIKFQGYQSIGSREEDF